MRIKDNILYFDGESQEEIVHVLLEKSLLGERVLFTDCGKNLHVYLNKEEQDEFIRSKNLDPARLEAIQKGGQNGAEINPAELNAPGSKDCSGPETIDPKNILMYGRGGSAVRVAKRIFDDSYTIKSGAFFMKVVEKTCPDEWEAGIEQKIMHDLKERGRRVAEVYRREGNILDIEMVSPTIYDFANTQGRSQERLEQLLADAMEQKLLIYKDLPEIIDTNTLEQIKKRRTETLKRSFPNLPDEDVELFYDGLKLIKTLVLNKRVNGSERVNRPARQVLDIEKFLELYERTYGWMLREERRVHARLLSDEYTRNRGIKDRKTIAFDFSPRFDIPQIDDMFLLQAGGNNLDERTEMRFVKMSADGQGREFMDYFATYIAATPTRSYIQISYILDDLHIMLDQLENIHTSVVKVSPLKNPMQYLMEFANMYASRFINSLKELVPYAGIAKQKAYRHGMNCYLGGLGDETLRNAAAIHNTSITLLGAYLEDFFERQSNSIIFKGKNAHALPALGILEDQILEGLQSQLF